MNSILYQTEKVNSFQQSFLKLVENDKNNQSTKRLFNDPQLNLRVPQVHKQYVRLVIDKFFQGDEDKYCDDIKLFFDKFTIQDKRVCDDAIVKDKSTKQLYKKKKKLILYSAQLLKLISGFRSKYITNDMLNIYKNDMIERDNYLENCRLVDNKGNIFKMKSLANKQQQQLAQILKTSKLLDLIATEKGFTYSFITLTLPGHFHPFPSLGHNSYDGATPDDAISQLNNYWQVFRATLSQNGLVYGDDLLGISVMESHKDSSLHKHILIYHSIDNTKAIEKATQTVQDNYKKKTGIQVNFDYRTKDLTMENPASGSTYIFKYITKTNTNYLETENGKSTNAVKNMAIRYFYGIRGYNTFGIKQITSKLNYLQKNIDRYKQFFDLNDTKWQHNSNYSVLIENMKVIAEKNKYVDMELRKTPLHQLFSLIKQGDMYSFYRYFEKFFTNIYSNDGLFIGVEFSKIAFENEYINRFPKDFLFTEKLLIEKKQYCIFEKNYEKEERKIDISKMEDGVYTSLLSAYDLAIDKQFTIDLAIEKFKKSQKDSVYLDDKNWVNSFGDDDVLQLYNIIQAKPNLYGKPNTVKAKFDPGLIFQLH